MLINPKKYQHVYSYTRRDVKGLLTDNYRLSFGLLTEIETVTHTNWEGKPVNFRRFTIAWNNPFRLEFDRYNEKAEFLFATKAEAQNYIKDKLQAKELELWKRIDKIKQEITLLNKQIVDVMEWDGKKS